MSAEQRRKDMKLLSVLSAFLFVYCIYVLNVHGIGEKFIQLRFVFHDSLYLNITPLETLLVDDKFDCSFACVHNKLCISFNLAETSAEKLWCELLPSSIYNNTGKIVLDFKFDHYSIQNPCTNVPCLNNGMCSLISFREGTYSCTCLPGHFGDECEIYAPECRDYNVLSQPNRHQSFGRGTNSDSNLVPGWYRFQSSSYSRMVDNCIQVHRCTTDITGWLKGGHPTFKDGIVDREACFHGWQNCCYRIVQIRVRECQGFYVYELNPSPEGRYRYCARG